MAELYQAQLNPSKLDLLAGWLPTQPWWTGDTTGLAAAGAFRFDDPAGEVGIEIHLVNAGNGPTVQVPVTYRAAPLPDADAGLIGTMMHSALGQRWVYDGCFDPVYVNALATTIATGGAQADIDVITDDGLQRRDPTTFARGSGTAGSTPAPFGPLRVRTDEQTTTISSDAGELIVRRVLDSDDDAVSTEIAGSATLTGTWPGAEQPVLLAWLP
jgi:Maltokinase N-terminal cap domain